MEGRFLESECLTLWFVQNSTIGIFETKTPQIMLERMKQ